MRKCSYILSIFATLLVATAFVGTPNEASAQYREMRSQGAGGGAIFGAGMSRRMEAQEANKKKQQAARKQKSKSKTKDN